MESKPLAFIKFVLYFLIAIFLISGIVLLAVGLSVLLRLVAFNEFVEYSVFIPPAMIIVCGVVIVIISIFGLLGAAKESYGMMLAFAIISTIIFIIEISAGVIVSCKKEFYRAKIKEILVESIGIYDPQSEKDRKFWAFLQSRLECCGVQGPGDWFMGGLYPASCCKGSDPSSYDGLCGPDRTNVYEVGCYDKLLETILSKHGVVGGVAIGLGLVQLCGIVLSCVLAAGLRKKKLNA